MATASAQPSIRSDPASHADRSAENPSRLIPPSNQTVSQVPNPSDSVLQPTSNGPDFVSQTDSFDSASTTGSDSNSIAADKKNTSAPFTPAPPPAVNIWKVRMEQLQDKVAKDKSVTPASSSSTDAPKERVKENHKEKANKDDHGHYSKERTKEERTKRLAEKERVTNEEEEMDAADGFVKVLSKAAKRSASQLKPAVVNGVGKKDKEHKSGDREGKKDGEKGKKDDPKKQTGATKKEVDSAKLDETSSTAADKATGISETPSTTTIEKPSTAKPSATRRSVVADPKTEASNTESVTSEHSVDTLKSISEPVSSPPKKIAKVVAVNARSEDRLGSKSSSVESGTLQKLDVWPTLGEQPQSSQESTQRPRATSPGRPQVNGSASGSAGEGKKTVWTKLAVPIRYTPPPSGAARKAQKEAGEHGELEGGPRRGGKGEKSGRYGKAKESAQKSGTASGLESSTDIESPVTGAPPTTSVDSEKGTNEPAGAVLVEQAAASTTIPEAQAEHSHAASTIENEKATATAPRATMTHPLPPPPPYANRANRGGLNNQRGPPRGNRNSAPPRMNNGQRMHRSSYYNNNMYPTAPFVQGPHQQNPYYLQGYPNIHSAPPLPQHPLQQYGRRQQYGGQFAGQPVGYPTYGYNSTVAADPERADLETVKLWIRSQVEYYFSIENLCRDLYFRRQMHSVTGSVSLAMIANFPRVKTLLQLARNKLGLDPKSGGTTPIDEPATTTSPATPNKPVETKYELKWALDIMAASLYGSELVEIVAVKESADVLIRRRENWEYWILNDDSTIPVTVNGDASHHATSPRQPQPVPISTHPSSAPATHGRIQQVQSATYGMGELSTPPNTPANAVPYLAGSFPAPGNVFFGTDAIAQKLGGVAGDESTEEGWATGRKRQFKGSSHQYHGPQQTQQQRGS